MHNNLRILVIAKFLQTKGNLYECFVSDLRVDSRWMLSLEDVALHLSSIVVSVILIVLGICKDDIALIITGCVGLIIIGSVYGIFRWLKWRIKKFTSKC